MDGMSSRNEILMDVYLKPLSPTSSMHRVMLEEGDEVSGMHLSSVLNRIFNNASYIVNLRNPISLNDLGINTRILDISEISNFILQWFFDPSKSILF